MAQQRFTDWELILVDDGSTDSGAGVARQWVRVDQRMRLISQPHGGIVTALQAGLEQARSPLIARMDADDLSRPERLQAQLDALVTHPRIGVVSSLVDFCGDPQSSRGYAEHVAWLNSLRSPETIALARFIESPVAHPSVLFRRELVERYGGYRQGDFPEDYELWLRWMDEEVRFLKVEQTLLDWHDPAQRLSRTDSRYSVEAFYRIKCRYLIRWLETHLDPARPIWLWGAGRVTRKRFRAVEENYRPFAGFIDVDPRKVGTRIQSRPVVAPNRILPESFVLVAVGSRGARESIRYFLEAHGRKEGIDYLCVA